VGEFIGANRGLGYLVVQGDVSFDTTLVFAALAVLTLLGLALFGLVSLIQKTVMRKYPSQQTAGAPFAL